MSLRHKLQKIFLQDSIKWGEMPRVDPAMTEIEEFPVDAEMLKVGFYWHFLTKIILMTNVDYQDCESAQEDYWSSFRRERTSWS